MNKGVTPNKVKQLLMSIYIYGDYQNYIFLETKMNVNMAPPQFPDEKCNQHISEKRIGYKIHTKAQSKKLQEYFCGSPNRVFYIKRIVSENLVYLLPYTG